MQKKLTAYRTLFTCFLFTFACLYSGYVYSQSQQQPYNRFQYHSFKWRSFHTEAFHIYFPYGYDSLAKFVATELPEAMERIKHRMTTSLLKTPNIIIYPSVDQLYESNIGLFEVEDKTLPTFVSNGSRMVLFFNGDHSDLKSQLYESLVHSIWEAQIEAGLDAQLKSNEAIPFWFKEGAIRYFAHQWTIEAEDQLRRSFQENNFNSWQEVIAYQPRLSGHAFCYFLTDHYYEQAMSQLYGQLKQKKDLRRSIRLIAKNELDSIYTICFEYYRRRFAPYMADSVSKVEIRDTSFLIPKKKGILEALTFNPAQQHLAYVTTHNNKRTVYSYNIQSKQTSKLYSYKLPPWISDHSKDDYPLIQWDGNNSLLLTVPHKKNVVVKQYSPTGAEGHKDDIIGIDGVTNLLGAGGSKYRLSGYRKGQSDIVEYDANRQRYYTITADEHDDTYLTDGIMETWYFLSSRPVAQKEEDTTKPPLAQGIYISVQDIQPVVADTVDFVQWGHLQTVSNSRQLASHTRYGITRSAVVDKSGTVTTLETWQPTQYLAPANKVMQYKKERDSIRVMTYPYEQWVEQTKTDDTSSPWLKDYRKRAALRAKEDSLLRAAQSSEPSFLEGVLIPKGAKEAAQRKEDSTLRSLAYDSKKVKPYILQLHSAYFSAQVNNDYFINRYQPYLNYQGQFKFPELGGMIQGGFTDLFENHHIGIGFRIPSGTEGSDFFFNYRNTAKKLDWGVTYFRKVETIQPDPTRFWTDENGRPYPSFAKVKTHYYSVSLSYPITYYLSAGLEQAVRTDRTIFLATDKYSLPFPDIKSLWSISTLYLKQYKLRSTIPLLHKGYKASLYFDGFKAFTQTEDATYGLSADIEYHLPLYRHITLVTKAQAGMSKGSAYLLYNVAGVDNNVTVKVDSGVQFPQSAPYAFQKLITPFRGYLQNSLYGNRYAVFNTDVYFPLFQTLIPIETPLSSINHLQLGLFSDIGTADETWQEPPLVNPWLWSYGFSARTKLAGYPIRFDLAWPGSLSKKPLFYFSLNIN